MKKKKNEPENMCAIQRPPWEMAKSKKDAYFKGDNEGYRKGRREQLECDEAKIKEYQDKIYNIKIESLKNICQAGATIIDAMAHAYMDGSKL